MSEIEIESAADVERRRQEVKAARVWARKAHPFDRSQGQDDAVHVYDDATQSDAVLVAFPGTADRLWIPSVDFFEPLADLPLRRIYIRKMGPAVLYPHELGTTVPEIVASLERLTRHHRRRVFIGTSLGGFHALLFGTLLGADAVVAVNPVTSLLRSVLDKAEDHRWDAVVDAASEEWLHQYGDMPSLWQRHAPPPTQLHYAYRYKEYCVQAEHIADLPHVTAVPYFENSPMDKLIGNGGMRTMLSSLLWPDN